MPTQHPPELVERVAREMDSIDARAWNDGSSPYYAIARYALDLAERAADEAVSAYRRGEDGVLTVAVERAVEGA